MIEMRLDIDVGSGTVHTNGSIELSDDDVAALFEEAFDGWCPVCKANQTADGDLICCTCLEEALEKHVGTGCCTPARNLFRQVKAVEDFRLDEATYYRLEEARDET
jgi:hypothetical protein